MWGGNPNNKSSKPKGQTFPTRAGKVRFGGLVMHARYFMCTECGYKGVVCSTKEPKTAAGMDWAHPLARVCYTCEGEKGREAARRDQQFRR